MLISVVVPVYNEGDSVRVAHSEISRVFGDSLPEHRFELIFVDDGSSDDSYGHLRLLASQYAHVRVLKLAQNVGSHMAIRAGLEHATGDVAVFLACDLQDPPDVIPAMLEKLRHPVQLVWAVRNTRQDSATEKFFSRVFLFLARLLVSKNLPPGGSSMFLLGPEALAAMRLYQERNLTLEGLFATMALAQDCVPYERQARRFGKSKWTLAKKLKLFADFFVGYSYLPIRAMSYVGMGIAALGFLYAAFVIVNRLLFGTIIQGWTSLMMVVLIMGGVQMVMLGIIGEYVWRGLDETRRRPRYTIQQFLNHPDGGPELRSHPTALSQGGMRSALQVEEKSTVGEK